MKANFLLILMGLFLISCRETTSDDSITKTRLRQQIDMLQDYNNGSVADQLQARTPEFKEKLASQVLESLDEETLIKLTQQPRFKELLKKKAETSQANMAKTLMDIDNKEREVFGPLDISVERKIGLKLFKDPSLTYQVHSNFKKLDCDNLDSTSTYWDDFIALQTNENALLGADIKLFERFTKSCLLFYRLRASMKTCQDSHLEDLTQLCQLRDKTQEE